MAAGSGREVADEVRRSRDVAAGGGSDGFTKTSSWLHSSTIILHIELTTSLWFLPFILTGFGSGRVGKIWPDATRKLTVGCNSVTAIFPTQLHNITVLGFPQCVRKVAGSFPGSAINGTIRHRAPPHGGLYISWRTFRRRPCFVTSNLVISSQLGYTDSI